MYHSTEQSMASKKRLSIVLDLNSAMAPYWPKIVSDYLQHIVRSFFNNSRGEGVNYSCEVSLVMFNASDQLDLHVQYLNWTREAEQFLAALPYLPFNGSNINQHTLVGGLAEAIMMFTRDHIMTTTEFMECERHCVLVAAGNPVTRRMLVSLPMIYRGNIVQGQFKTLHADFLHVARMFVPLGITLSLITPSLNPMFVSIFNEGNSLTPDTPFINYGDGQVSILLSANLKEALNIPYNKEMVGSTSMNKRPDAIVDLPLFYTNSHQEDLHADSRMTTGQSSNESVQNLTLPSGNIPSSVNPQETTDEMNSLSPSFLQFLNDYGDLVADLMNDDDTVEQDLPRKKPKTCERTQEDGSLAHLLQQEQPLSIDEILGQVQIHPSKTQVQGESTQMLRDIASQSVIKGTTSTAQFTPNLSERVNIPLAPGLVYRASTSTPEEGSSRGLGCNMGVVNPILNTQNFSNSNLSHPLNNPNSLPEGSNARNPPQTGASFGDSMLPNTTRNLTSQFQPPSFPVRPYGSDGAGASSSAANNAGGSILASASAFVAGSSGAHGSAGAIASACVRTSNIDDSVVAGVNPNASTYASHQQLPSANNPCGSTNQQLSSQHRFEMSGFNPEGAVVPSATNTTTSSVPVMSVQHNQKHFWPRLPPNKDFKDFELAWEGCLVGKTDSHNASLIQVKAFRRLTSPVKLTDQWSSRLEIALFLPKKAVVHTMKIYGGPIDYVFFQLSPLNNRELYHHLKRNNLCAKVVLQSHTLIVSTTTESKNHFIGTIFPGDTVFVEPL